MKILAISGRIPAVDKNGDQVISFFRITHLARRNSVELVCFGSRAKPDDLAAVEALEAAGVVVHLVPWKSWVAALQVLRAIPDPAMPFQCAYFRSSEFGKVVNQVRARFAPDALYAVMIRIVPNAADYQGHLFVDMVDSMGLNFGRRAGMEKGPKGWLLALETRRVAAYERAIAERADRCFVVSRIDQQAIGSDHVGVLPLGIDVLRFNKSAEPASAPLIAFTGNMFYQPNVDAVLWFAEHCWPAIKRAVPGVRLAVVGNSPQPSVVALGKQDPAINVMGRVPSVAAILKTAAVAVAPMRSGSGMQFKILEAMACGVPVVATSIGQGDIGCVAGCDILVRDNGEQFAQEVIALLHSPALRAQIGNAGFDYVQKHHSWDAINQQFVQACHLA
jgi:glycosyltransferase involved in cell wall biosynthesis